MALCEKCNSEHEYATRDKGMGPPVEPRWHTPSISRYAYLSVVAHGVDCPCVFNDEKCDPLWLSSVDENGTANNNGERVYNKKSDIKFLLMTRGLLVICNVPAIVLETYCLVYRTAVGLEKILT